MTLFTVDYVVNVCVVRICFTSLYFCEVFFTECFFFLTKGLKNQAILYFSEIVSSSTNQINICTLERLLFN